MEHARNRDEGLHERGAEWVNLAKHRPIAFPREQDVHDRVADRPGLVEGGIEFLPGSLAFDLEDALSAMAGKFRSSSVILWNRPSQCFNASPKFNRSAPGRSRR